MSNSSIENHVSVRYPLRRHRQEVAVQRTVLQSARSVKPRVQQKKANWGARILIAVAGWIFGVAADSLVMFADHHFHLAKDRDPDLFALVLGTGFAGHAIYAVFAALCVTLLAAFNRQRWILWLLIGFAVGLASI
ncbi:MAG: hypothetical protein K5905_10035 [Roseibium sp.]|uniref:hypothetical protein n=1 Tax=Roseibium sp. TaxID=1936156 RepID=UPI0026156BF5|nr:hypothetical protein [Roseibium sp.]MCV0425803.1 hypothetical protein [Roseibium sp.]